MPIRRDRIRELAWELFREMPPPPNPYTWAAWVQRCRERGFIVVRDDDGNTTLQRQGRHHLASYFPPDVVEPTRR